MLFKDEVQLAARTGILLFIRLGLPILLLGSPFIWLVVDYYNVRTKANAVYDYIVRINSQPQPTANQSKPSASESQ